jgi:hypothetical protein
MKTRFKIRLSVLLTGILVFCTLATLKAQERESLIYGSVVIKYSSGEVPLNSVMVEIYNEENQLAGSAITSESGNFSLTKVKYGTYFLKIRKIEKEDNIAEQQVVPAIQNPEIQQSRGKYYSYMEEKRSTRIKFKVESPELDLSKITVYPMD